jgi:hypothetical protein
MTNHKHKIRETRAALKAATCTCHGKHDPFWVQCSRTLAEIAFEEALTNAGFHP